MEEDGEIEVEAASRIPGVPQHNFKVNLTRTIRRLTLGGSLMTTSNQYLRGAEANPLPMPDGFTLVNVSASYALARNVPLTARVTTLLFPSTRPSDYWARLTKCSAMTTSTRDSSALARRARHG